MKFISGSQFSRFWMVYLLSAPFAFLIRPLLEKADYQGWISLLAAYTISLVLAYFAIRLGQMNLDKSWVEFGGKVVGKWPHYFFVCVFCFYCIHLASLNVEEFTIFFSSIYLANTPDWVVSSIFVFCTCLAARLGIRTIVYLADIFFLLSFISLLLIIPALMPSANYSMSIGMITDFEWQKVLDSFFYTIPWFGEIVLLLFLFPHLKQEKKLMRYAFLGSVIAWLSVLVFWYMALLLFGPYLGSNLRFTMLEMIRFAEIGQFLENIDPLVLSVWSTTLLIKDSLLIFIASKLLAQIVGFRDPKTTTFLIGALIVTIAHLFSKEQTLFAKTLNSTGLTFYMLLVQLIPIVYVAVHAIKGRFSGKGS
ncbi:GerAB/ArcD/ProY family transporter [Paenibacillus sp. MSJ-34]|uniref:GerAB/ArcD/ProY family transporter n=1 Tax=Paenibacillus sp. MSJ-34 TaxID=2841529 RepID=UPI001C102E90|nr:GerAB/ArcD/ProY family transporter [Paenibacillus sp. MSJ-34]MBU5442620.1 spore germination protein [Paenibacillus sp. MSJ-34]